MHLDVKGIVAVLVVIAAFGLVGVNVVRGEVPDPTVIGLCGTSLGLVLGFYFGHVNGVASQAASAAAQMALQSSQILAAAQQRRAGDADTGPTTPPLPPAPPAPRDV